ncbi:AAA domain-containing protein [Candidatus Mycoplasma pogonae]
MAIFEDLNFKKNTHINELNVLNSNKYKTLLNNLLVINNKADNAVFTKIGGINLDLSSLLSKAELQKVFSRDEFKIKIKEKNSFDLIEQIQEIHDFSALEDFLTQNHIAVYQILLKKLKTDFKVGKSQLIQKIETDKTMFLKRWKSNVIKITNIYQETNIWPLFVSTFFILYSDGKETIYAPLLLKEVEIIIENNDVFLVSRSSSVIVNDKVSFILNELLNIDLPKKNSQVEKVTLQEASEEFLEKTHNLFVNSKTNVNFLANFEKINTKKDLQKTKTPLTIMPGLVLNLCAPLGGNLREAVINLIENKKIDNLVNVDVLKDYSNIALDKILNHEDIVRVTPTDISQEKAILGALDHSAIIIGPPGTGKSQTIANILTNILANNKKALFISQKKVALDAVLKRMDSLSDLMLQFTSQQKSDKKEKEFFYQILKNKLDYIKKNSQIQQKKVFGNHFVENIEIEFSKIKAKIYQETDYDSFIAFTQILKIYNLKLGTTFNFEKFQSDFLICYDAFNKFSDFETFSKYWENYSTDKRTMAQSMRKISNTINLLVFKINLYDAEFKTYYEILQKIKQVDGFSNFKAEEFALFNQISNIDLLKHFIEYYKIETLHEKMLKNKSLDNTNLNKIKEIVALNSALAKKRIEEFIKVPENNKRYRAFNGRVERSFTQPQLFITLFRDILKEMFDVVVGTPEQLATFIDFDFDKYDYVIFDEASQMFFEKAIPFISIGKKLIVAGDDQQMQPSNWFSKRWEDEDFNNEESEITSLLDWARQQGLEKYHLEMNYRSQSSELVLFSSKFFYQSNLKAIDNKDIQNKTALEVIEANGAWNSGVNEIEAEKTIAITKQNFATYKSIIILTFNGKQQDLIFQKILNNEPELLNALENGKLTIKNIENIQGDEADLVIASVVYDKTTNLTGVYVVSGSGKNALNVAITRAKNKMIVVKSIHSSEVKIKDENNDNKIVFKKWLEYLELQSIDRKNYTLIASYENLDSLTNFRDQVYKWLKLQKFQQEFKIKKAFSIGSYKMDIALLDSESNEFILGIDLDAYFNYDDFKNMFGDIKKRNFIKAKNYPIYRITLNKWHLYKKQIAKELSDLLNKN